MIYRDWCKQYLEERGMWPKDGDAVVDAMKAEMEADKISVRWIEDSVEGYPPNFKTVAALSLRSAALRWIDKNQPQAWYRAMFVDSPAGDAQ